MVYSPRIPYVILSNLYQQREQLLQLKINKMHQIRSGFIVLGPTHKLMNSITRNWQALEPCVIHLSKCYHAFNDFVMSSNFSPVVLSVLTNPWAWTKMRSVGHQVGQYNHSAMKAVDVSLREASASGHLGII